MSKGRLEAFSDGVIAIIITIMVLELKVPHGSEFDVLLPLIPTFLSYLLSFVFVGIYWNNHHHTFQAVHHVDGGVLWANLHLLFWLSIIPFATGWMGENHFEPIPVALYGLVLIFCALAYFILIKTLVARQGPHSPLAVAVGKDKKGMISLVIYLLGFILAFFSSWLAMLAYVAVALIWLIPDRRIEKVISK